MNLLSDLEVAVTSVAALSDRKARVQQVSEILVGNCDVGTRAKPNPNGIALLQRRALFITELSRRKVWTG